MCTYSHKTTKKKKEKPTYIKEVINDHKKEKKKEKEKEEYQLPPLLPPPKKNKKNKTTTTQTNSKQPQICLRSGQKWVLAALGSAHFLGVYCLLWPWHSWGRPGWVSRLLLCWCGDEWFIFHTQVGHLRSCGSSFRMMGVAQLFIHSVLVGTVHRLVTILFVIKLFALAICETEPLIPSHSLCTCRDSKQTGYHPLSSNCLYWPVFSVRTQHIVHSNSLSLPLYLQRQ